MISLDHSGEAEVESGKETEKFREEREKKANRKKVVIGSSALLICNCIKKALSLSHFLQGATCSNPSARRKLEKTTKGK